MLSPTIWIVVWFMFASTLAVQSLAQTNTEESVVVFRISGQQSIRGGKFGSLAEFQHRLASAAKRCGIPIANEDRFADGTLGPQTFAVILKVAACPDFANSLATDDPARNGAVSSGLWRVVAPDLAIPDGHDRSHTMTLSYESTDYTDIEFNVGTTDPGILTWGPLGATAGQAQQVQAILLLVDQQSPQLIDQSFASEAHAIRLFANTHRTSSLEAQVSAVNASASRAAAWRHGFAALGAVKEVRDDYDIVMGDAGTAGIFEGVADFYCSYWANGWRPTEIDYAFFFDRAVQMDVRQAKTTKAVTAVRNVENRLQRSLSTAERRRAISANFTASPRWAEDRLARDVAYYIDAIPAASLTNRSLSSLRDDSLAMGPPVDDEAARWEARSGKRASDFGLSDERLSPAPPLMAKVRANCNAP
ncbi:hypothetical protein [Paraburkholderia kururiensis]|uniref:Uncharacterized protein n=1 Tax=Paraburkholderia kururiensis TaxID=984307 RepID=A0ABZ0WFG3_9BURK|nr:hypothetical protein [Paraburkholderia kururiensis]WQD76060.1 hypothetical protein U0042_18290 [Paraburkholderia kururiensis]